MCARVFMRKSGAVLIIASVCVWCMCARVVHEKQGARPRALENESEREGPGGRGEGGGAGERGGGQREQQRETTLFPPTAA